MNSLTHISRSKHHILMGLTGLVCMVIIINSCGEPNSPGVEFMPDMFRSPSNETYGENFIYNDSMAARLPVVGTIPRGYLPYAYTNDSAGYAQAGLYLKNPIELSDEILAEGKVLYGKFCIYCHGSEGNAAGKVAESIGHPPPPSYSTGTSARSGSMRDMTEGKIYHTIMYGLNTMGSHVSQLTVSERWKIIHYVQKLQKDGSVAEETDSVIVDKPVSVPEI